MQRLTHINGAPVVDNTNTQTAGPRGPVLLQDIWLLEKLAHFDGEVIPERRMHAKGSGAFGTFTVTHDITRHTKAKLFDVIGKTTDAFVRFSTVAGERDAADAERDIRGFSVKLYTDEGNWDFWTSLPEALHQNLSDAETQADACAFNPFDLTKVWPHQQYPPHEVGVRLQPALRDSFVPIIQRSSHEYRTKHSIFPRSVAPAIAGWRHPRTGRSRPAHVGPGRRPSAQPIRRNPRYT